MTPNTMKMAAEASNFSRPHTDTNGVNFHTGSAPSKAIAPPVAPSTNKAEILTALELLFDPADVYEFRPMPTKKRQRIHDITDLGLGDFLVYTNNESVYCKDLEAVKAFAQKLRVTK